MSPSNPADLTNNMPAFLDGVAGALAGAIAGGELGVPAGPAGVLLGMLLGGLIGADLGGRLGRYALLADGAFGNAEKDPIVIDIAGTGLDLTGELGYLTLRELVWG